MTTTTAKAAKAARARAVRRVARRLQAALTEAAALGRQLVDAVEAQSGEVYAGPELTDEALRLTLNLEDAVSAVESFWAD